ncbi:MAG TPA: 3-oxoacyl-[acyl-carrier-protein] synthase III C-terminal domain-containing protein [Pseudonocardiaceae bacterium]|nr:3-oxoacyl-[acyl-carrier-protein] synthase III C-terminal domain-containing protein [Pseudonocardiaceae bacterium]
MTAIHLSAFSYELGDPHSISELGDEAAAEQPPSNQGLANYLVSHQEIRQLAKTVCKRTLEQSSKAPDLIVYVSENDRRIDDSLARIASEIGLPAVRYLAVSGHGCGNLVPALLVVRDALSSGRHDRILLVFADRALDGERQMLSGLSVFSDGAAACMVTGEPEDAAGCQAKVTALTTRTQVEIGPEQLAGQSLLTMVELATAAVADILRDTGCARADFGHVLFPNYRMGSQKFLTTAMGLPPQQLLAGPVGELGHCFSADILITLAMYTASGRLRPGDRLLASATGTYSWSIMAVEITRS